MAYKLQITGSKMVKILLAILSLTAISLSSCTKKKDVNPALQFVGTWNGISTCSGPATLTFAAGSGNTVIIPGTVGYDTCKRNITYTLTAYGTSMVDTESFTDACGNIFTVSMSASLNGGTLTYSISDVGAGQSGYCIFTGTKQY